MPYNKHLKYKSPILGDRLRAQGTTSRPSSLANLSSFTEIISTTKELDGTRQMRIHGTKS